ncbi:hypothetical protein ACGFN1_06450 [Streptomyces sp. NPDC048685]
MRLAVGSPAGSPAGALSGQGISEKCDCCHGGLDSVSVGRGRPVA